MQDSTNLYEQCYYYGTMNTGFKMQKCSENGAKCFNGLRGKKHEFNKLITEYMECDERSEHSKNVNFIYTAAKAIDIQRYDEMSHIIMHHDSDDLDDPRSYIRDCSPFYYKGDREPKEDLHSIVIPPLANSEGEWLSLRDIAEQYQLMDWHKLAALLELFYANLFRDDTLVILLDEDCFSYEAKRSCYRQAAEWMLLLHMIVPKCCGGYNEYSKLRQKLKYCVTNKADGHDGSVCFIPRRTGSFSSNQKVFDYTQSYADTPTDSLYAMIAKKIQEDLAQDSQTEQDSMRYMQDFLMKLAPTGQKFDAPGLNSRHLSLSNMLKAFDTRKQSMRFSDAAALITWKEAGLKEHLKKGTFTSFNVNVCVDYLHHLEKFAEQGGREQIPAGESLEILWQYLSGDSEQYLNEMLFLMTCSAASDENQKKCMLLRMADKETFLQRYCQQPDNYLYALTDRTVSSVEAMKDFCELLRNFFPQSKNVALALTERLCGKVAEEEAFSVAYGNFCACMDGWKDDASEQAVHAQFLASFLQKAEAYCQEQPDAELWNETSSDQAGEWLNKLKEIIYLCEKAASLAGNCENEQKRLQQVRTSLCQYIEAEVQTKNYTHLFRIEPSFDKIGFLRLWGKVGVSNYPAVYEVISETQCKSLTFFYTNKLPTTEEMPEEEAEKGWMAYTLFLLYCMLLSDEPNTYFTDKDTFQQLQKLIKTYKWETPVEHKFIRDFLCLPKIMERHKTGYCPDYFVLANHVSPKYRIYKELYPYYNNDDIGKISPEEQTTYPTANNLLAYAWICVIVPEIIGYEQAHEQPETDNDVDEETLCEMFQVAFPNHYKNVLTENEQEKLLTRIQTLAQQFLDNRSNSGNDNDNSTDNGTASGNFYCILAQYSEFHNWLSAHAETIYTECLTSLVQQYSFYNTFRNYRKMPKRMDVIVKEYVQSMEPARLKKLLQGLLVQEKIINGNDYEQGGFGYIIVETALNTINSHLEDQIEQCPFESFCCLSHEEQMKIVKIMWAYCDIDEDIQNIFIRPVISHRKVNTKERFSGWKTFLALQKRVNAYDLEASIYYDEASHHYNFNVIQNKKNFFSSKYSNISDKTLKYIFYAMYMFVFISKSDDYSAEISDSLNAYKDLSPENKEFLIAYLKWLLDEFKNRDTTDARAYSTLTKKIKKVLFCVSKKIDTDSLSKRELYGILWDVQIDCYLLASGSTGEEKSFFDEYGVFYQVQKALSQNSIHAVYNIYPSACYAYQNNVVMGEEKKQLYGLLKQSYDKMGRNDKYKGEFEVLTAPSDEAERISEPASEFDAHYNMPSSEQEQMPVQNPKGVVYGNAANVLRQAAKAGAVHPTYDTPDKGHETQSVKLEAIIKKQEEPTLYMENTECQAFVQLIRLSTEENIRRFEECVNNGFDEATQKLWDEWLDLYFQVPKYLRNFIFNAYDYITQEELFAMQNP